MARPPDSRRDNAISTIRSLCEQHGPKEGSRLAREQFGAVPKGSWDRWRIQAIGRESEREEFEREARARMANDVRQDIPAVTELVGLGTETIAAGRRALDFWRLLDELCEDAQLMREFALSQGSDGKRKVKIPFALRDAHRMRCDLIRLALQHAEAAHSVERADRLYDAIMEEVTAESPEVARRIVGRLRRLEADAAQRGF